MAKTKQAEEQDNEGKKKPKTATKTKKKVVKKEASTTVSKTKTDVKVKIPPKKKKADAKEDKANVVTHPPFLLLFAIMAGIILEWIFPTYAGGRLFGWIGFFMFAAAVAIIKWSLKTFKAGNTSIPTDEPTDAIVTNGPYKYSRNPIYVAFLVGFIGLSFMADSVMMFLMVIPLFYTLALGVIIPEEEYLTEKFGDEYLAYKQKVRRWF